MKYHKLGCLDQEASVIALGAWAIGGGESWGKRIDDQTAIATIHAALDAGVNFIDTAPSYGFGHSEELVGKALAGHRDEVVIATKCGLWWDDDRGSFFTEFDGRPLYRSLRPDTIAIEIDRSLRRLKTDRIDLYQTHWPAIEPDKTPLADTMGALADLVTAGKIRAIGVCNVSPAELEEHLACGPVASDQFRYSMLHRQPEADILPLCRERGLATLTYMSLEQGLLTGKVTMDTVFDEGDFRTNGGWHPWYHQANRHRVLEMLAGWKPLCSAHDCTLAQLVLAWTLAQPGVTHVLAGARRPEQIRDTAVAADLAPGPRTLAQIAGDLQALGGPDHGA